MGGLRLTDFSDPESANGDESSLGEVLLDLGFSSGEEEHPGEETEAHAESTVASSLEEASLDVVEELEKEQLHQHDESADRASFLPPVGDCASIDVSHGTPMISNPTATPLAAEFRVSHSPVADALVAASSFATPLEPIAARSPSVIGSDSDSPLPIARAPAVIPHLPPHLARSIRAESGSPYRALPPTITHHVADDARDDTTLALPTLSGSPTTPCATHAAKLDVREAFSTPSLQRSALPPASVGGQAKAGLPFRVPASAGPSKTLARSVNAEKKVAARVGKIKNQLDTVFVNRLGPPQRSASGASSTSSSSSTSTQTRPLGMSVSVSAPSRTSRPAEDKHTGAAKSGSASTSARPVPLTSSSQNTMRNARAPLMASGATRHKVVTVPKPFAASASTASRQPLAPRMAPPATQPVRQAKVLGKPTLVRPGVAGGRQTAPSVSAPTSLSPPHAPSNPLKRPLPMSHSTLGRAVVSTSLTHPAVRPASSLPARALRETPSVGAATFAPAPIFHPGLETVGMVKTTLKSPPHLGTLRPGETPRKASTLVQLTAVVKTCSCQLGTPMKLFTPGRARLAATPLGKSRLNALSPVRPSAALLLGTPGRPTRIGRGGEAIHPAPITRPPTVPESAASPTKEPSRLFGNALSIAQEVKEHPRPAAVSEDENMTSAPERGSSVEYADVSFSLAPKSSSPHVQESTREASSESTTPPGSPSHATRPKVPSPEKSSPQKKANNLESTSVQPEPRRPKRSIKPPTAALRSTTTSKPSSTPVGDNGPAISEKELRAATQRNTDKNTVYLYCTIDRQIVRQSGPRPPSPTSKIRTTADRDEEEKKAGRGERAKRRSARDSTGTNGDDTITNSLGSSMSNVERVERARGPGDDHDYETPARPSKKIKTQHERRVAWDRELVIIRDDGRLQAQRQRFGQAARSALRADQVSIVFAASMRVRMGRRHAGPSADVRSS